MFETKRVFASFAVKDVAAARGFYEGTLGLRVSEDEEMGLLVLHLGDGYDVMVYPKPDHTPATYTVLNLAVTDIDAAVAELGGRGVRFETYEGFAPDENGIHRGQGGPPIAWLTDPSGNILAVLEDA